MQTHAHKTTNKKPNKDVIAHHFRAILIELGISEDQNTIGTPARIAKLYVDEVCAGRYTEKPAITKFTNHKNKPLQNHLIGPIPVRSLCSHHFAPVFGACWIGFCTDSDVTIGLSKWSRLVQWYAARPQMQEQLCEAIVNEIEDIFAGEKIEFYVLIKATHTCMSWRGVQDKDSSMVTLQTNMSSQKAHHFRSLISV